MNHRLINIVREEFTKQLQAKTGWGRLEVIACFDRAVFMATTLMLDELDKATKTQDEADNKAESTPGSAI